MLPFYTTATRLLSFVSAATPPIHAQALPTTSAKNIRMNVKDKRTTDSWEKSHKKERNQNLFFISSKILEEVHPPQCWALDFLLISPFYFLLLCLDEMSISVAGLQLEIFCRYIYLFVGPYFLFRLCGGVDHTRSVQSYSSCKKVTLTILPSEYLLTTKI